MEISLASLGSSQTLPLPHFITLAASRFCSFSDTISPLYFSPISGVGKKRRLLKIAFCRSHDFALGFMLWAFLSFNLIFELGFLFTNLQWVSISVLQRLGCHVISRFRAQCSFPLKKTIIILLFHHSDHLLIYNIITGNL